VKRVAAHGRGVASALLFGAALVAAGPAAGERFWPRAAQAPAVPGPSAGPASAGRVALRLVDRGSHHEAWVDNGLPGPVQAQLRLHVGDNVRMVPAPPARAVVPAWGSAVVARIYRSDPRRPASFDLALEHLPGDPAARPHDVVYRLPFEHGRVRVDQGYGGRFSHADAENRHAVDFALPEGTPVLAAREGVVLDVEAGHSAGGPDYARYRDRANYVRILHPDGSMAAYAHLQAGGVLVRPGERVRAGQRIGLSGNTGYSTAPHLHFVVQVNRGMRLESVPFRMAGPAGELKFPRTAAR